MSFFKAFFASLLAFVVGSLVLVFLFFIIIVGIAAMGSAGSGTAIPSGSILHLELNSEIVENAAVDPSGFDQLLPSGFGSVDRLGLFQLEKTLKQAAEDPSIEGIYLNMSGFVNTGWAGLSTIRRALLDFKESGKFIYAYSDIYTEQTYYLATTANKVALPREGLIELNGLVSTPMFWAGMFDKLELEPKVFKVGTFKSAVEPFTRKDMSPESKAQSQEFLGDFWSVFLREVAISRNKSEAELNQMASELIIAKGKDALAKGLIDEVLDESQMFDSLKTQTGIELNKKLPLVSLKKYMLSKLTGAPTKTSKNKISVIFAEGTIQLGKGSSDVIGSQTLIQELRKVRYDDRVKAVVLRINSPGGSALASDQIQQELLRLKETKPVIASMGSLAASGGYYIAAPCDSIFAQENTLTGSIGIFSILLNTQNFFDKKLGITFDEVETHPFAGIGNPNKPMTKVEEQFFQRFTNEGYGAFIKVVQTGRNFPDSASVDKIAQGRVWSGKRAKALGLVDQIGSLQDAIDAAAAKAKIEEDYTLQLLPRAKTAIEEIMETLGSSQSNIPDTHPLAAEFKTLLKIKKYIPQSGMYALMPYEIAVH